MAGAVEARLARSGTLVSRKSYTVGDEASLLRLPEVVAESARPEVADEGREMEAGDPGEEAEAKTQVEAETKQPEKRTLGKSGA